MKTITPPCRTETNSADTGAPTVCRDGITRQLDGAANYEPGRSHEYLGDHRTSASHAGAYLLCARAKTSLIQEGPPPDEQGSTHDERYCKTKFERRAISRALFDRRSAHANKRPGGSRAPTYFAGYRYTTATKPL